MTCLVSLVAVLVLLAALPSSAGTGDGRHLIRNLSNNGDSNSDIQISGTSVVWRRDGDIYLHDGTDVTNLSNSAVAGQSWNDNSPPQISGSNIVWERSGDIYQYDGTDVTILADGILNSQGSGGYSEPRVSGSNFIWRDWIGDPVWGYNISLHDGTGVTNLLNNPAEEIGDAQIDGSNVVWRQAEHHGAEGDIYLHNGTSPINLSNDWKDNVHPQISGSNVVWRSADPWSDNSHYNSYAWFPIESNIDLYDGTDVTNLSNGFSAYNTSPQISGSNVVWSGNADGDSNSLDIYLYNGTGVTNLSNNLAENGDAQIDGSNVVWYSDADGNRDIYLYNGTGVTNLSDNAPSLPSICESMACGSRFPQISGSNVVWRTGTYGIYEIYAAYWLGPDAVLNNLDLSGEDLSDLDFSNADMTNADLASAILTGATISAAQLQAAANVTGVDVTGNNMTGFDLTGLDLTNATLTNANLTGATLTGATLTGVISGGIIGSPTISVGEVCWQLTQGYLIGPAANLTDAALTGADLTGGTLTGANLTNANLGYANLSGVTSGGILGTPSVLPINWQLTQGYLIGPEANLTNEDLTNVNLTNATLTGADLTNATLTGATLTGAVLTGANLHQALLPSALPSLPVINGAVVKILDTLAVSGSVQVDTGGNLWSLSNSFTAGALNMQGGTVHGSMLGLDLDEIGDISGHGRLFGDVELGASGAIAGSGAGLELFGHVSGTGTISGTSIFGNVSPGNSAGQLGLTDVVLSSAGTLNLEIGGTDTQQYDQVTLAGTMSLAGDLEVQLIDSFVPQVGDIFSLFNLAPSTNLLGGFSDILLPELASGVWDATGLLSSGNLLVISPGPNPCGLGGDSGCSTADLDALYGVLGTNVPPTDALFDLNSDNVVDAADLSEWLSLAATENGHSSAYLRGDTDLDRNVDLADYSALANNFDPTGSLGPHGWNDGNSDGDNDVDLADYNVLASNFSPAGYGAAAVPEPTSLCLLLTAMLLLARVRF